MARFEACTIKRRVGLFRRHMIEYHWSIIGANDAIIAQSVEPSRNLEELLINVTLTADALGLALTHKSIPIHDR